MSAVEEQPAGPPDAFEELGDILKNQNHLFACSGSIPIRDEPEAAPDQRPGPDEQRTSRPVTIRWDTATASSPASERDACVKLTLPIAPERHGGVDHLCQHAQPATFGRGGEDVLDESYRKALKIDTDSFCSTFDPYTLGIIDTIAQVLLPSATDSKTHRSVRAELYKLNVYSAPSGMFKSHVDTPRSTSQFGSLVVCLPLEHEGGQLKVRHKGKEMTYDWSTRQSDPNHAQIHWAAFYSDCEHEILEVTKGHRITLTYNLYAVRGAGRLTGMSKTLNPTHLPLYEAVKTAMNSPRAGFDGKGGSIIFWCSHIYAYNHHSESPLPDTLKGVDAVIWEIFQSLGLKPRIAPFVSLEDEYWNLREWYDEQKIPSEGGDALRRWAAERPGPLLEGPFGVYIHPGGYLDEATQYQELYIGKRGWDGKYHNESQVFLNERPSNKELQILFTAYGNNAEAAYHYSHCGIVVDVPCTSETEAAEALAEEVRKQQIVRAQEEAEYLSRRYEGITLNY
ncbi:hypothetical protein V2G26_005480 [Clonostachys chloroleuca]